MDRYFWKNGESVAFNPLQIADGFADGLQELSDEERHELLNPPLIEFTPGSVTRAQGKASLINAGLFLGVLDYVNSIEDATEKAIAEVALNDTTHWQRKSPFLNDAAQALGLTDAQLDQLFIDASKIEL